MLEEQSFFVYIIRVYTSCKAFSIPSYFTYSSSLWLHLMQSGAACSLWQIYIFHATYCYYYHQRLLLCCFTQSSSAWSGTARSPFRCDYCTAAGRSYTVCHSFNCRRCCGLSTGWVPLTHNCAPRANGCLPVVQKKTLMGRKKKKKKKRARPRGFSASPCSLGRPPIQTETNFWQQSHFQGNRGGPLSYWKAEGKALFPGY